MPFGICQLQALHVGHRNALALKFYVDATAQLARDFILARWGGSDLQTHSGSRAIDILHAKNARAIDQRLGPGRIAAQIGGRGFKRSKRSFDGRVRREGNIHESLRPVAAKVGDGADFAVGNGDKGASGIADHGAPQGDVLDPANSLADLNGVPHNELIFENDIESGDDVADEILRAETQGQAGKTCESGDRYHIDAKLGEGGEDGRSPDDFAAGAVEDARDRTGLLFAALRDARLRGGRPHREFGKHAEEAVENQGDDKNHQEM